MNLYKLFEPLLQAERKTIATVSQQLSDGTVRVQYPAGGTERVLGSGWAAGDQVFVRGGRVEGAAPALPFYSGTI